MSYTVQPVVNRISLKARTFKSEDSAHRFILRILNQYNLEVNKIIENNVIGAEEYICHDEASRFFVVAA